MIPNVLGYISQSLTAVDFVPLWRSIITLGIINSNQNGRVGEMQQVLLHCATTLSELHIEKGQILVTVIYLYPHLHTVMELDSIGFALGLLRSVPRERACGKLCFMICHMLSLSGIILSGVNSLGPIATKVVT